MNQHADSLRRTQSIPEGAIEAVIDDSPFEFEDDERIKFIRHFQSIFAITQGSGTAVLAEHEPWLRERSADIDFYYWNRQREYYLGTETLPPHVVSVLDQVSSEILDYSGNPAQAGSWRRRGMVMGHVQSGKTTNYSALIAKAADAGYKIIILLAGLTNSLRAQTQERIDETFIGKKSIFQAAFDETLTVAEYGDGPKRFPAYGTSRDRDFKKENSDYGVTISALKEPIIFVMKKNKSTLENLAAWLDNQMQGGQISHPLLLVDDEADNASINTQKDPGKVTAINGAIRSILNKFTRSTYVGYTATPFANIFIDPDTETEMYADDLFPRHFIKALDPPSNYVGAERVFRKGPFNDRMVEVIDDYADLLPLKHKNGHVLAALPESLRKAVRVFILAVALRHLRGDGRKHCSMMINVSRFNDMQEQVLGLVYAYVERLKNAIRVNAGLGSRGMSDPDMQALKATFEENFEDTEFGFGDLLADFHEAVRSIETRTVNMRGGALDYSQYKGTGLHVIAIGGLALSRGLTLEGLCVSYILRNTAASDTLMQMARWFGYRPGYEDLCRLYLPKIAADHYDYITEAIEELRAEIKRMRERNETPEQFGLKVRRSETGIAVTAANKMRAAEERELSADLSGKHVEGFALHDDQKINAEHLKLALEFIDSLGEPLRPGAAMEAARAADIAKHLVWSGVPGKSVRDLLEAFSFPAKQTVLSRIEGRRSLALDYINDRLTTDLSEWDVVIPLLEEKRLADSKQASLELCGARRAIRSRPYPTHPEIRTEGLYRPYGLRNRIADPGDAEILLTDVERRDAAEAKKQSDHLRGDRAFCLMRKKPLLLVHMFRIKKEDVHPDFRPRDLERLLMGKNGVSLSFCFPATNTPIQAKRYHVNPVWLRTMREDLDEARDDDEEAIADDGEN